MVKHRRKPPSRRVRQTRPRILLSLVCAFSIICSTILPLAPTAYAEESAQASPQLENLIIDRVYELTPVGDIPAGVQVNDIGFAPEITEYEGTAYSSVDEIQVYPFAASDTADVLVNGQPLNSDGYLSIDVSEIGVYEIAVSVVDNNSSNTYTVTVDKVDTDYRGRRAIVKNDEIMNNLSISTAFDNEDKLMEILAKDYLVVLPESKQADGSYVETDESYWSVPGDQLPDAQGTEAATELFTVDLGDVYSVSRIRAAFGPSNLNLQQNRVRISVSTDGQTWESPVTKGNMNTGVQWHQNVTRYEFGVSYDARYIRFEVTNWQFPAKELRIYQFMLYYDAGEVPEKQPAPEGASVPHQHEERHQYIAGGQATVIERGLTMAGWTPSSGYGRGVPTAEEAEQFGYDGPLFYDPDFENPDYMLYNPDSLWGIAKAPFGGNGMGSAGEPRDFIPESMKPYIGNAVSFCFGDEGGYSTSEAEAFAEWFDWTREHYPGVILHSNQCVNQWGRANLEEYLKIAQPDMLTWDDYYGDSSWASPSSINLSNENTQKDAARRLLGLNTWSLYRELAYGGIDGTGAKPILFGQYVDSFALSHSQSNKNLIVNASILSGAKWLNFFRVEFQFDRSYLWDEDGTPTRGLLEWGQIIDRVHAIDDQLTRLNNDWIMFKLGEMGSEANASADGFRMGNFDDEESQGKNREFGLASIDVKSLSTAHNGQTGDVVVGYYNTLPGLYESEIKEYFEGSTAPKAFMVMNGLVAGQAEQYNKFNIPAREAGSANNTRQQITVTVTPEFAASHTLYMVDKDDVDANGSGKIKEVPLSDGSFTVTLGGGEANLYFWDTNASASASSAEEGAYASFAFDALDATYWQPAQAADSYTLENTFSLSMVDQVTIMEKGSAIQSYRVEYLDEAGEWKPFGEAGSTIGAVKTVSVENAVAAQGIRLVITSAEGLPAIYSIKLRSAAVEDPDQVNTITVNDNTLGDGLFRFCYDELWSYRETEANAGSISGSYPLENDGHFSNWANAEATFQFYGTKAELLLRADQAANIQAAVFNEDGTQAVTDWKSGVNGQQSLVFDGLSEENAVYTLKIQKKNANQAGIDGIKISYLGDLPEDLVKENSPGASAVQEYVDQRTVDTEADNYFSYDPEEVLSKDIGADNAGFAADADEENGWVQHVQDGQYQNLGFTRTNMEGASYTLHFYGTGVQLYSGVTPMGDKTAGQEYGTLTFTLDGNPVEAEALDVSNLGTNGKISARMWTIQVPEATENGHHTLTVTVSGGYSRIDYAVVNRYWQEDVSPDGYTVTATAGEHGSVQVVSGEQVQAGGNAVIQITPEAGYQIDKILVNDISVEIPTDGILVLTDIQKNTAVQVTFQPAVYDIVLDSSQGGSLIPSSLKAREDDVVTLTPEAYEGYELVEGSVTVVTKDGTPVTVTKNEASGAYEFTMPGSSVTVSASFQAKEAVNKNTLEMVIALAQAHVDNGDVDKLVPSAKEKFMNVLNAAKETYASETATQIEVDQAWKDLMTAIQGMGFVPGDKTELIELVAKAKALDLNAYEDGAEKDAFTAALEAAEELVDDPDAMELDIDAAYQALNNAMQNLIPKPVTGDKSELKKAIDVAESFDLNLYVDDENKESFLEILTEAKDMYDNNDTATQAEIDAMTDKLLTATAKLRLRADKETLNKWLEDLQSIDLSQYTEESAQVVRAVIAKAQALAAQDLSRFEQYLIDEMVEEMMEAKAQLVPSADSEDPKDPDDSSNPGKPGDDGSQSKDPTDKAPTTGDSAPLAALSVLALAAAGALVLLKKRIN